MPLQSIRAPHAHYDAPVRLPVQINRKYDFLSKAKVCLDLCAAPGGWCQVAARHMPSESVILGIDLLPIRPIRNVKTIVQDITTAVRSLSSPLHEPT